MVDTTYRIKVEATELEHLRQFTDNKTIAEALDKLDTENKWKTKLTDILVDMRLWPIVATIVDNREAHVMVSPRVKVKGKDLLGYKQDFIDNTHVGGKKEYDPAVEINREVQITRKGWDEAIPIVQETLDAIQAKYATPYGCGLICHEGEYWKELHFVNDVDAVEHRMFNAEHKPHPSGKSCLLVFPSAIHKDETPEDSWARITKLPAKRKLVCVDGWTRCPRCGLPMRPKNAQQQTAA